ncbi:MAG: WD40 repeat domain-containing protein [Bacteroidetes bacterium]|nr:WD40 repeat domain-containing protein [Bacteroidota bacterium]
MSKIQVTKLHTFQGHRDCVYTLQPGNEPHLFFSAGGDGMVVCWNLQEKSDGELIARVPHSIYALHHLAHQRHLVAGQNYSGIHLIDYQNKKEIASLQLGNSAIFDIQSSQNKLIVCSGNGMLTVVDIEKWSIQKQVILSERSARSVSVNPFAGEIAVGFSDHQIRVFDLDSLQEKVKIKAHNNSVFALSYSPDGKFLLSGARDAKLKVWSAERDYTLVEEIAAHLYAINHIVFSPDSKFFATCSMDKSIKVWDYGNWQLLKVIDKSRHAGHGTSVNKLLWTPFNNQLVSASDDRTISAWDLLFL